MNCYINPATGRAVKATSRLGKKLAQGMPTTTKKAPAKKAPAKKAPAKKAPARKAPAAQKVVVEVKQAPAPKKRGRPPKAAPAPPAPKKRGRPVGSKNKPKM